MTQKHTTGPWYAWERNEAYGWITDTPESDNDSVPYGTNIIAKVQHIGHWPTSDANARFIVAACNAHDDLLAALEALLATEDDPSNFCYWCGELIGETACNFDDCPGVLARAAIAKAEGR